MPPSRFPPSPTSDHSSESHAWEKSHADESRARRGKAIYRLDYATRFRLNLGKVLETRRMVRHLRPGNFLDIGCGAGVRAIPDTVPYGIEISKGLWQVADAAAKSSGGSVVHGSALEGLRTFPDGMFTGILMRSYLEHEISPRDVLAQSFLKLAPGGTCYIKVPNYACAGRVVMGRHWCGFRLPDHVNYFSVATLSRLAQRIGFRATVLNAFPSLDDNIFVVLHKT